MNAQYFYDARQLAGTVSGIDLHRMFTDLVGDPSPSGQVELDLVATLNHPTAMVLLDEFSKPVEEVAALIAVYSSEAAAEKYLELSFNAKDGGELLRQVVEFDEANAV